MNNATLQRVVYLDHAATSWPKPPAVGHQITAALSDLMANAGRSGHAASLQTAHMVFEAREQFAALLGVPRSEDLVFVRGCTEGLNLAIKGFLHPGASVAVSPLEHNSVMRPLMRMVEQCGVSVKTLPADPFGRLDLDECQLLVAKQHFDLVAVCHASNVTGVVQDLAAVRGVFADIPLLVDAAQTAGVLPIHIARDGINFLACSAHKGLLGPTGVGLCYLDPRWEVAPLLEGGTGSRSESLEHPPFRPDRYEAGTLNLHGIAGAVGGLQHLESYGLLGEHKLRMTAMLLDGVRTIPGVQLQSPSDAGVLCVSLTIQNRRPDEVAMQLEEKYQILCRPGLQCAPAAHQHLQTFPHGTVRLSPGWSTTEEDIEIAIRAIHCIAKSR